MTMRGVLTIPGSWLVFQIESQGVALQTSKAGGSRLPRNGTWKISFPFPGLIQFVNSLREVLDFKLFGKAILVVQRANPLRK